MGTPTPRTRRIRRTSIAAAAAVLVTATVTGCGSSSSSGSGSDSSDSSEKIRVSYIAALVNDSFFVTQKCGAQDEAKSLGVDLKFQGPTTNDASAEIKAFAAAAATNPDAMIVAPFSNTGFGGTVRPLMAKGVPVAATGQKLEPADAMATFITDYKEAAKPLTDIIGQLTGGTGTVGLVADTTGNTTDSDRYTELVPALEAKYPGLKVLDPQYAENSTSQAASITSALISGNPDMKVVYATSGPEAVGAASAIKAAKKGDTIKLVSFDSSPQQITLLQDEELAATVGQSPYKSAQLAVQTVVKYVKAHPGSDKVPASAEITATPSFLLTPENVDSAEGKKYQYLTSCG